ncbi:MAG: response regulator transcription factor [Limisphaerales bacterium]
MAYLLIVDDDPDFAGSVSTVCKADGHEVLTVHSPAEALASVATRRPDGILLDVMFPEDPTAGFRVARELDRKFGRIPILLLTAVNQEFPLGFSHKDLDPNWLPAVEFVEKPVDFALLREKIKRLVGGQPGVE